MVVEFGVTNTELPERLPGIQLYDTAPEAVSVVEPPAQSDWLPLTVTGVTGLTEIVIVDVLLQPMLFTPVTVYVVVVVGATRMLLPVRLPGIQV